MPLPPPQLDSPRSAQVAMRCLFAAFLAIGSPGTAHAQEAGASSARVRAEARVDGILTQGGGHIQVGAGASIPAGTYVRVAGIIGAGAGGDGLRRASGRVDLVARFLLDPFAQQQRGFYAIAGIGLIATDGAREQPEPRVVVGVGVEGAVAGGRVRAVELGLGGGVRIGLALRASRQNRR